jgi:hypothetical protein
MAMDNDADSFVAECFWPDVREQDVRELDERVAACIDAVGSTVRCLGSILIREDEVVLCQFEGRLAAVREVVERARVPFERLLETVVAQPAASWKPTEGRRSDAD